MIHSRASPLYRTDRTAPHRSARLRTGPQCSRPPVSERCGVLNMGSSALCAPVQVSCAAAAAAAAAATAAESEAGDA